MPQLIVSGYLPAIVLTAPTLPDFVTAEIDAGHTFVESCQRVIRFEGIILSVLHNQQDLLTT
ncbi:hypothetical protein [Pantoea sp. CCBC3-3-1]|uniref:hypothetical protein n=1 Tax=Pantoea sp. CCBC3-3-1 TaxID=2490851 RepID=UPI0011BE3C3A|nr:hypothetical protein [Pantoea sp. CCBC3-3-1]